MNFSIQQLSKRGIKMISLKGKFISYRNVWETVEHVTQNTMVTIICLILEGVNSQVSLANCLAVIIGVSPAGKMEMVVESLEFSDEVVVYYCSWCWKCKRLKTMHS